MNSILSPSTCGFLKISLFENECELTNNRGKLERGKENIVQYEEWKTKYENFSLQYKQFVVGKQKVYNQVCVLGKSYSANKRAVMEIFSSQKWSEMSPQEKRKHTIRQPHVHIKHARPVA